MIIMKCNPWSAKMSTQMLWKTLITWP